MQIIRSRMYETIRGLDGGKKRGRKHAPVNVNDQVGGFIVTGPGKVIRRNRYVAVYYPSICATCKGQKGMRKAYSMRAGYGCTKCGKKVAADSPLKKSRRASARPSPRSISPGLLWPHI